MSNFLAETMNLFIGRQSFEQSMIIQAGETVQDQPAVIPRKGVYSFDLNLINSKNILSYSDFILSQYSMYTAAVSSSNRAGAGGVVGLTSSIQANALSINMYNRAISNFDIDPFVYGSSFGPPVTAGQFGMRFDATTSGGGSRTSTHLTHPSYGSGVVASAIVTLGVSGSSFDPFTPPYYNGFSTVRVSLEIDPRNYVGGAITREEIFASASYEYDRLTTLLYPITSSIFTSSTTLSDAWAQASSASFVVARQQPNFKHRMQLSASMFLGDENPNQVIYEREAKINPDVKTSDIETRQIVAFKPRWECPVLDFTNAKVGEANSSGSSNNYFDDDGKFSGIAATKGMWHQYGQIPSASNGIFMRLEPGTNAGNLDMLQLLNINPNQISKIGKIHGRGAGSNDTLSVGGGIEGSAAPGMDAKLMATFTPMSSFSPNKKIKSGQKQLAEAIIAIPFKYDKTTDQTELYPIDAFQTKLIKDNMYRDNASRFDPLAHENIKSFEEIRQSLSPLNNDLNPLLPNSKQLYDLMLLMRKFVIPPHLDFLHNDNVDPFVMFMIEYSIDLKQKDLQNIWQNVEPTFSRKALRVTSESNMHLMPTTDQMFNNSDIHFKQTLFDSEVTRWAVFKVKKRGAANYNSIVGKIIHNNHEYIRKDLKGRTDDFLYSYNWPHDFFSLIELAKINSITTFNPIYSKEKGR